MGNNGNVGLGNYGGAHTGLRRADPPSYMTTRSSGGPRYPSTSIPDVLMRVSNGPFHPEHRATASPRHRSDPATPASHSATAHAAAWDDVP